jgi:hypothetical protein
LAANTIFTTKPRLPIVKIAARILRLTDCFRQVVQRALLNRKMNYSYTVTNRFDYLRQTFEQQ